MYTPTLIAVLVFVVVILMTLGLALLMRSGEERRQVVAKMRHSEGAAGMREAEPSSQAGGFRAAVTALFNTLGTVAKPKNESDISHLKTLFLRAGSKGKNPLLPFFGAKVLLAGVLLAASYYSIDRGAASEPYGDDGHFGPHDGNRFLYTQSLAER